MVKRGRQARHFCEYELAVAVLLQGLHDRVQDVLDPGNLRRQKLVSVVLRYPCGILRAARKHLPCPNNVRHAGAAACSEGGDEAAGKPRACMELLLP